MLATLRAWCLLPFAAVLVNVATAAPPTVTYLLPSGARHGTTLDVVAGGTFERWPVTAWCDHPGVQVTAHKTKGKLTVAVAADVPAGLYWLRLADEQGASPLRPFFVGSLPEVAEKEPNDDTRKPHVLEASSVVNGRLDKKGDVDCFALAVKKGQTLVASLEANRTLGSPMDAVVQIATADGAVVAENHDHRGLDPQAVYAAPADGTYVVRVFAFPSMPDSTIAFSGGDNYVYRLTVSTAPFVEHAFPLAVEKANPGTVELVGWNIAEADRRVPATDPRAARSVRFEPHPTVAKAKAQGKEPQTIALPVTVSGVLDAPRSPDRYRFEAKKGQKLTFELESRSLDFDLSGVLKVTDAGGKVLQRVEGAGKKSLTDDPTLAFTPSAEGVYHVEVSDLLATSGPRHAYRLRCLTPRPDFAATLAADRFAVAAGKTLDVPVTIDRRDGFMGDVTVTVENLPNGVTANPAVAKGAEKTATLKLTAGAGAASGSVRVVAKAGELTRPALASPAGQPATEHVWVTVTK